MLKNYSTQEDIKKYIPNLEAMIFRGTVDWSGAIAAAGKQVHTDFMNPQYKPLYLRNDLTLRISGAALDAEATGETSAIDDFARNSWIVNVSTFTGTDPKIITLEGSDDLSIWSTVDTLSVTAAGQSVTAISDLYAYYRVNTTVPDGTIDYKSFLTESSYDLIYEYAIVANIYLQLRKEIDDTFDMNYNTYLKKYEQALLRFEQNSDLYIPQSTTNWGLKISRG